MLGQLTGTAEHGETARHAVGYAGAGGAGAGAPVASAPAVADEDNILFCLMFELDMQDFLYQVGLVNEKQGDECLEMETTTQGLIQHCAL